MEDDHDVGGVGFDLNEEPSESESVPGYSPTPSDYDPTDDENEEECAEDDDQPAGEVSLPPPAEGMAFESHNVIEKYYALHGKLTGFQTHRHSLEYRSSSNGRIDPVTGLPGIPNMLRIKCAKAGKYEPRAKNPNACSYTIRTQCPAMVNARMGSEDKVWRITKVNLDHNHEVDPVNVRFMKNYRHIPESHQRAMIIMLAGGVGPGKVCRSLAVEVNGYQHLPYLQKDVSNFISRRKRSLIEGGDFKAMGIFFEKMARADRDFYVAHDTDENGVLRNVFWADGRSRAAFKDFGDVVSYDATYVKNRYKMPFTPFIGVNHHGQSILLGCAIIQSENTASYT